MLKINLPIIGEEDIYIRCSLSYNKDTYNYFTSSYKKKGYQITMTPIVVDGICETSTAFTGFYEILHPVERQSKKRLAEAESILISNIDRYLEYFTDNYGYQFDKDIIIDLLKNS